MVAAQAVDLRCRLLGGGCDAEALLSPPCAALYDAICRVVGRPPLERRVQRGALLETDLRRGLEQGEFVLHYQPQVTLTPGALGISALIRWRHPQLGLIGPERFLSLAEENGLLEAITGWLFEAACDQARRWHDQGFERVHLALPLLSRQQLAWSGLTRRLGAALGAAGLHPGSLEVEIAEDLLLGEADAGGTALAALKKLGVRLALDGYGRGPTSLRGLQLGVLDTLKLARELHQEVPADPQRSAVVAAVVALARALGLRVVAEGVDRQEQLICLRRCGCDAVQAFMSCPPLPAEACAGWLRQASARRTGQRASTFAAPAPRLALPQAAGEAC